MSIYVGFHVYKIEKDNQGRNVVHFICINGLIAALDTLNLLEPSWKDLIYGMYIFIYTYIWV